MPKGYFDKTKSKRNLDLVIDFIMVAVKAEGGNEWDDMIPNISVIICLFENMSKG